MPDLHIQKISWELSQTFAGKRGHSERSVRRFCAENGITRRSGMTDCEIVQQVKQTVAEVSSFAAIVMVHTADCIRPIHTWDHRTVERLCRGIHCSKERIGNALQTV
jgi:hypothetical protein